PQAFPMLERAVGLCRQWNIPAWFPPAAASLGHAYVLARHLGDGVPLLHEAIDQAERMRIEHHQAPTLAWLSEAHLLDYRPDEALSLAQRELDRSRHGGYRGYEAYALRVRATILASTNIIDTKSAEGDFHRALTLATELGMRPLVAHCHAGLAALYRRANCERDAKEHFIVAMTMYREME